MENNVKLVLRKLFLQNALTFKDFFVDIITSAISYTHITCDVMCVQYAIQ